MCGRGQDYINIELDSNRNQLIRVHTLHANHHWGLAFRQQALAALLWCVSERAAVIA
jgi:hypothetical protein